MEDISGDKFMKILIACGIQYEQLRDWSWEVIKLAPHKYHCIGSHPVVARIDVIKENIVV